MISIEIPEGVTSIGRNAFYECSKLVSIYIPEGVTNIGYCLFYDCYNLENVIIPKSVTSIENFAFQDCLSLTNINIPEKVSTIGSNAFRGCLALTSINIPESLTSIGSSAFERCNSLVNVDIPKGVTCIESFTFSECSSLESINILGEVTIIEEYAFSGCVSLINIQLPQSLTSIGEYAFSGCSNLISTIIPEKVTSIGKGAFRNCNSFENIEIPESVEYIGKGAFSLIDNLYSINVMENNKNYLSENGILFDKMKTEIICYPTRKEDLKEYNIPNTVTSIGEGAFYKCSKLNNISIPQKVTNIERYAFYGCSSLENLIMPEGIANIGESMFYGCTNLINMTIPKKVTSIGSRAFYECSSLESIILPEDLTNISWSAFEKCINLRSIYIPEKVTSIGSRAFSGCKNLQNIDLPKGITSIEQSTFSDCSSLTNVIIPKTVTSIGINAFMNCNNLKSIIIPKNVISISDYYAISGVIYTTSNSEAHKYAEEYNKDYVIDDEGPQVTFTPNGGDNPQKEYTVKVNVEDNQEVVGVDKESLKYLWTQSEEEPSKESFTENFENEQNITKNQVDGIWYLWVYAEDNLGNERITRSEGFKFDNTKPNVNVEYNTKLPAKSVEVTITSNEEVQEIEGWTLSEDKKVLTKEYDENIGETITIRDIVGNETETSIEINNIDKTAPDVKVEYSTQELTRENVLVTMTANEEIQEVEGWTLSEDKKVLTKEYSENTKETITIRDIVGNETKVNIEINNIDKEGLIKAIEYSTKNPTKENVVVTIIVNEEIQEVEGWELSENKKELTKEYSENAEETIVIQDIKGNELKINIKVENIDRKVPEVKVEYSTSEITKDNVLVTVTSSEEIQEVEGWTLLEDKKTLTKEYAENTNEIVAIKDLAGNETKASIEINNIDKSAPDVQVEYSTKEITKDNVIVTITSNEEIQEVEGWNLSSDKKTLTKEYTENTKETITIKDLAGNETQANIEISNIDKTAPNVNVEYSTKEPTNKNVIVTVTANEAIQEVEGWTLSNDKKALTKEYTENTKETITIKDLAGNETQANIEITNIDKTLPDITIGDINQDEKIDVTDLLMLKRHLVAGNKESWKLTGDKLLSADMNKDGNVDITDMLMLKKLIVKDM